MYQSHWGLRETPFRGCLDPGFFYPSPTHDEALARLHFLVEQRRRLGLLLGESGSGKSLLYEVFAAELERTGRAVAKTSLLGIQASEMLWQLIAGLGRDADPAAPIGSLWRTLTDRITEYRYQRIDTVLLLDDVDRAARGGARPGRSPGPIRPFARRAADDHFGRPARADRHAGRRVARVVRASHRHRALGTSRHGKLRPAVVRQSGQSVDDLRRPGRRATARAHPRRPPPRQPTGRSLAPGRGRPGDEADRRRTGRVGLPGVGRRRGLGRRTAGPDKTLPATATYRCHACGRGKPHVCWELDPHVVVILQKGFPRRPGIPRPCNPRRPVRKSIAWLVTWFATPASSGRRPAGWVPIRSRAE